MTEPTDAELDAVLCNQWPAFSMQATLVRVWVRAAMRDALAKFGTPPAVAGEPVAWQYRSVHDKGAWFDCTEERAKSRAEHPYKWDVRYLYAAPQPAPVREPLPMPDLTQLTERGATAWAGVDAQALRGECTLQDFDRSMAVRAEGRKPFTPAQQERLYRNRPANVGKSASLAEWRRTVEFVEAAHGITANSGKGDGNGL